MEQKKLLWILFSVTLVLLVMTGAGFFLFFPRDDGGAFAARSGGGSQGAGAAPAFEPLEWVRDDGSSPAVSPNGEGKEEGKKASGDSAQESDEFVIVYGEAEDEPIGESLPVVTRKTGSEAVSGRQSSSSGSAGVSEVKPAAGDGASAAPGGSPSSAAAKPAETKRVAVTEYWIQAGSFQSRTGAQDAHRLLGEKGFTARLTTTQVDGTEYYRVRLGPYANREEAEKFLAWVKEVDPFGESYISQVNATRMVTVQ